MIKDKYQEILNKLDIFNEMLKEMNGMLKETEKKLNKIYSEV